jgi:hypothetical protein
MRRRQKLRLTCAVSHDGSSICAAIISAKATLAQLDKRPL